MADQAPEEVFKQVQEEITEQGFTIVDKDWDRPWGGFFVIQEDEASQFAKTFFGDQDIADLTMAGKLSPKVLLVQPDKRLSWQYHHRRSEIWRVLEGQVGVMTSDTDEQGELDTLEAGEYVKLKQGERHRLVGLDNWGILAEIWQHTDPDNPSHENDIVRVQDDYGR